MICVLVAVGGVILLSLEYPVEELHLAPPADPAVGVAAERTPSGGAPGPAGSE